jgi:hypothetical protein
VDENPATIMTVNLKRGQPATFLKTISEGITPPAKENLGFEGVALIEGYGYLAAQVSSTASALSLLCLCYASALPLLCLCYG